MGKDQPGAVFCSNEHQSVSVHCIVTGQALERAASIKQNYDKNPKQNPTQDLPLQHSRLPFWNKFQHQNFHLSISSQHWKPSYPSSNHGMADPPPIPNLFDGFNSLPITPLNSMFFSGQNQNLLLRSWSRLRSWGWLLHRYLLWLSREPVLPLRVRRLFPPRRSSR